MSKKIQLRLMLWKIWILQKRKKCVTVFEILLPVAFALLLFVIRGLVKTDPIDHDTIWSPFSIINATNPIQVYDKMLLYSPQNSETDAIMQQVMLVAGPFNVSLKGFDTADEIEQLHKTMDKSIWAAVIFDPNANYKAGLPQNVNYSLRVTPYLDQSSWQTQFVFPFFRFSWFRNDDATGGPPDYAKSGFTALQFLVDRAILSRKNLTKALPIITGSEFLMQKMPWPPVIKDPFITSIQRNLPLFLILGFILSTLMTVKSVVYEKERKLKEAMKLMGLQSNIYWLSWFIKSFLYLLVSCVIYTIFFIIPAGDHGKVLNKSDPSVVFVFLLLYCLSIIAYCFMMSTFFNKANTAASASGILYFVFYFPYFFLINSFDTMTRKESMAYSLLNNVGMAFGLNLVGIYEGTGEGAQWSNFSSPPTVDGSLSLLDIMIMLLVDSVLYFLVAWYMDNIKPGEFGVPQPLYFPFLPSYWCGQTHMDEHHEMNNLQESSESFEREPVGLKNGISIQKLRKTFGRGKSKKVAVENTCLNMYEGQISVLLGHNGAGKTTTMSMLTGFLPPTSGTAYVDGYDIRTEMDAIRKSLGLCPQHNILFDTMTVEEHLNFFAELKGCPRKNCPKEVNDMIKVLQMESKRDTFAANLSGGQKRKLSVGIALIAGSKVVILDEPSSGMDPAARRQTWDILQKFKSGRTLVLTTHFMDEADALGDRIAIMADGVVKCCGTSHFLKKIYGAGYHLVIVKTKNCNVPKLTNTIKQHVPSAELESEISAELSYLLPFDQSSKFEDLFTDIESKMSELGISSFGTSATTMEEVFLRVGESAEDDHEKNLSDEQKQALTSFENKSYQSTSQSDIKAEIMNGSALHNDKTSSANSFHLENTGKFINFNFNLKKNTGYSLSFQQFFGMFVKKLIHSKRNTIVTLVQLLVPVIFTILALTIEKTLPQPGNDPTIPMDLSKFGSKSVVMYSAGVNATGTRGMADAYKNQFADAYQSTEYTGANFIQSILTTQKDVGITTFNQRYMIGAEFFQNSSENVITTFFNGEPFHTPGIALAATMNGILQYIMGGTQESITTYNFPFQRSLAENSLAVAGANLGTGFTIAFVILFGMAFLSTSFIIFLIKERSNGAKHLQKVSGVSTFAYWASSFTWDMINFMVPVLLIMVSFAAFQTAPYTGDGRLGYVFLLFFIYGAACLPFVYILHFMFNVPATGMVVVTMLNIITGLATLMAVFVLQIPTLGTVDIANALDWIFTIFIPHYCLGFGLMNMYTNYGFIDACEKARYKEICGLNTTLSFPCCADRCGDNCFTFNENYLAWEIPGIGKYFVFMSMQCVVYFFIIAMVETGFIYRPIYFLREMCGQSNAIGSTMDLQGNEATGEEDEDSDVRDERLRINDTPLQKLKESDSLILKNLTKYYGNFQAVKGINVGVPPGECFGLLGQNGAGKTTTFKMLTGDVLVTNGNAFVNFYDIKTSIKRVQQNLGYCPQFDALIDQMTGRETLVMYARLRGVQEEQISHVVDEILDALMLTQYGNKNCAIYSGGNKRKLSTAISLIGDPPFVLLDEPTTGMDPGARRQLWNVLSSVRASGRTLVLTSHSMEECDALCTKIVIMVNGKFVCLGSPQHLKNKFGHGYTLVVRLAATEDPAQMVHNTNEIKNFIASSFPNSKIFDDHQGYIHFQILDNSIPLGKVFGKMEQAKSQYPVEDYSVHQTTLEQVFLTFTRNQIPVRESTKKSCLSSCLCCL